MPDATREPKRFAGCPGVGPAIICILMIGVHVGGATANRARAKTIECDLLVVGGTESSCAAAVQAARMGVERIVVVNDIGWLGGQFSAEALTAIDENRGPDGYDHTVPFPRHGAFREIIDRIEADNLKKYGVARPGNTRVITTCRPSDAARVFREWLEPYIRRNQIVIYEHYEPADVIVNDNRVGGVRFTSTHGAHDDLTVTAALTIDGSDWGDCIRLSGAAYEFGPDLKEKYGEPLAPDQRRGYPETDMNPITYCMVINETDRYDPIAKPAGYDPRNYRSHGYPKDPLWLYDSRRLVDHYHFREIKHPDVVLLCFPAFDYPLDVYPAPLAAALESHSPGASTKNIVQLSPPARRLIFDDAKRYALGFLYYLQTEVHDAMPDKTHSFRRFELSDEFGTPDRMPMKPYVRESLRMKAMYMMRQQDTTGVRGDARNYATAMYHDGVAAWQFEYDFHPTRREFTDAGDRSGPWRASFREGRTWGPPYSGLSLFALRSLIPEKLDGLLGAQKNLGYSSIVSSAVRLHDQSMAIGQASGATAAIAIKHDVSPRVIPWDRKLLVELQTSIATGLDGGMPGCVWPYRDLEPDHAAFTAINVLSVQRCLPLRADEVDFRPEEPPARAWMEEVIDRTTRQLESFDDDVELPLDAKTRAEFVSRWWKLIRHERWKPYSRQAAADADLDGIADAVDALPLDPQNAPLAVTPLPPEKDGLPGESPSGYVVINRINFAPPQAPQAEGYVVDSGAPFDRGRGYGWRRDKRNDHRQRGPGAAVADTFVFTREADTWEYAVENGSYHVTLCVGDRAHDQPGQRVAVEGMAVIEDESTASGTFLERTAAVDVRDGRLSVQLGPQQPGKNTCLNWIRILKRQRE